MERNSECFISLLSAYIRQGEGICEAGTDWEEIYQLGKIHSLSGMVYLALQADRCGDAPPAPILRKLKQDFTSTVIRAATQEHVMKHVIEVFARAEIAHILFKGYVLKAFYPAAEVRTMGDIDILIQPADRQRTHELLIATGFEAVYTLGDVWTYAKGKVRLEIHERLFSQNLSHKVDCRSYFEGAWDHAVKQKNGYTHEFSIHFHFLYLLVHMAKHFHGYGCGIRMIMDAAVYLMRYGNQLDWHYISAELNKLELTVFANHIFGLCERWFDVSVPVKVPPMEERFYREVSDYILSAGTFGLYQRNRFTGIVRKGLANQPGDKEAGLLKVFLKICFPDYERMAAIPIYSFVKNRPALLPAAWILRALRGILLRGRDTTGLLIGIVTGRKEYKEQDALLTRLGL